MTTSSDQRLVHHPTPEDRAAVDALVADLPAGECPGDRGFDAPWQLRAFALAVAAHEAGQFEWTRFQTALIESIAQWEGTHDLDDSSWSYYEHWVAAFEDVLGQIGVLETTALEARTTEVLATPKNKNHHEPHPDPVAIHPAVNTPTR